MNEPSEVTHVTNENDAPTEAERTLVDRLKYEEILALSNGVALLTQQNVAAVEALERIANGIEAYCRLHGAKT